MCVSSPFALACTLPTFELLSIPQSSFLVYTFFLETSSIGSNSHPSHLIQLGIKVHPNNRNRHAWDVDFHPITNDHHGINDKAPEYVSEPTLELHLNPQPIPDWHQVFGEWLRGRELELAEQGYYDIISFKSSWTPLFREWLQRRWSLLHNQGLRDPTVDRPRWLVLFDFWFSTTCNQLPGRTQHFSSSREDRPILAHS